MTAGGQGLEEARYEVMAAAAFGREPATWAVEAVHGADVMSDDDALDVLMAETFGRDTTRAGRPVDPVLVGEAGARFTPAAQLGREVSQEAVVVAMELVPLIESRMGMSTERALLHVKSEILRLRECQGSTSEWVTQKLRDEVGRRRAQSPIGGR